MADINPNGAKADGSQLRERPSAKPLHLNNPDDAKRKVLELNNQEEKDGKDEDKKKTYGRVPDGTGKLSYLVPIVYATAHRLQYTSISS
jgi:phosphatidylethanolamine N-methyltransferase